MWRFQKPLKDRDYKQSATYRKYKKHIGKLVSTSVFVKFKKDLETGRDIAEFKDVIYLVTDVRPHAYYRHRFAYKLTAFGDHNDYSVSAAELLKLIAEGKWKIVHDN